MTTLIEITDLEKSYGGPFKLGPLSLTIEQGETLALLGKNGAGKTTFFQIITGSVDASAGEVRFLGKKMIPDAFELKRRLGYLPQNLHLPRWVSGNEMLHYAAKLYEFKDSQKKINEVLKYWDCDWFANRPLAACSHGMQKRIALALSTLHDPELLILDEPFSGLDLFHIKALEETIQKRSSMGKATIICTHIAPYAAKLCERVITLETGQMRHLEQWATTDYMNRITAIENYFFLETGPDVLRT